MSHIKPCPHWKTIVADFSDYRPSRRKRRQFVAEFGKSPNWATVAVFGNSCRIRRLLPKTATVTKLGDCSQSPVWTGLKGTNLSSPQTIKVSKVDLSRNRRGLPIAIRLLITNRKSHTRFRLVPETTAHQWFWMTLNDRYTFHLRLWSYHLTALYKSIIIITSRRGPKPKRAWRSPTTQVSRHGWTFSPMFNFNSSETVENNTIIPPDIFPRTIPYGRFSRLFCQHRTLTFPSNPVISLAVWTADSMKHANAGAPARCAQYMTALKII